VLLPTWKERMLICLLSMLYTLESDRPRLLVEAWKEPGQQSHVHSQQHTHSTRPTFQMHDKFLAKYGVDLYLPASPHSHIVLQPQCNSHSATATVLEDPRAALGRTDLSVQYAFDEDVGSEGKDELGLMAFHLSLSWTDLDYCHLHDHNSQCLTPLVGGRGTVLLYLLVVAGAH